LFGRNSAEFHAAVPGFVRVYSTIQSLNHSIIGNDFSRWRSRFGLEISGNQTRAFVEADVRPRPREQDNDAIPKTD
jgi:hypothetical protein